MHRHRDFLLLITLATAAAATPALAQTSSSAAGPPNSGTQRTASIPDLSGIWGRNWFRLEPPSSGPGPVVSKLRRPNGTLRLLPVVGDYSNPILRPQAAEAVKKTGEMELGGAAHPNPHSHCWPEQTPFTLGIQLGMQMIQQKDEVTLLYLLGSQVRHVRMNVPHSEHPTPTWYGESVGHYDDDTLVIDTIGQKVGPLSTVDTYGTPMTAALHVIERYRLIDGTLARDLRRKHEGTYLGAGASTPNVETYGRSDIDPDTTKPGLQVEITVDDPATFTVPWSALVTYSHVPGEWPEAVCAENTRGSGSSWVNLAPRAEKPDF
jgi:hypothetical protein